MSFSVGYSYTRAVKTMRCIQAPYLACYTVLLLQNQRNSGFEAKTRYSAPKEASGYRGIAKLAIYRKIYQYTRNSNTAKSLNYRYILY